MSDSKGRVLRRALNRREVTALMESFAPLASELQITLVEVDGRHFAGSEGWDQDELAAIIGSAGDDPSTDLQPDERTLARPLVANGELIGLLIARGPEPSTPQQAQVLSYLHHNLTMLATQSLEKRSLAQETLERYREISLLYTIGETITACLDSDALPELILEESSNIIANDAGAVFLTRRISGAPEMRASQNLDHSNTVALRLAQEAAWTAISSSDPHMENERPITDDDWVQAILSVPLKTRERVLGSIVLLRGNVKGMFTAGDEKLLSAMASQTAVALENARLYTLAERALERREGQLSTAEKLAHELNQALSLGDVMDAVIERCREATEAAKGAITTVDENNMLNVLATKGFKDELPIELQQLSKRVIRTRETVVSPRAHLVVPILLDENPLGIILLVDSARDFGPEDATFIGHLAAQAATAIHNAQLYSEAEKERSTIASILSSLSEAIIVTDDQQRVLALNPAAASYINASPTDAPGQSLERIALDPGMFRLMKQAAREGRVLSSEVPAPDGRTFRILITPVPGTGFIIALRDISFLKELGNLKSGTELHQEIVSALENAPALVDRLIDALQVEAGMIGKMERCDPAHIARVAIDSLRDDAEAKQITLRIELGEELPPVEGNPDRLVQAIAHLIHNAIKFTPVKGRIIIEATTGNDVATITVNDNGMGIAAHDLEHLFERFYRTSEAQSQGLAGAGLGLHTCKSIVEQHGGRIWAESEWSKGSSFYIALPIAERRTWTAGAQNR